MARDGWGTRLADVLIPSKLGRPFRWLVGSAWASNLGDGILLAVGPLLVASLTSDPRLIALGVTVQWLPALLLSLVAGVVSDRASRWRVLVAAHVARLVALGTLIGFSTAGHLTVEIVLGVLFVMGGTEVFIDNTSATLTPALLRPADLDVGNARIEAGFVTMNRALGPPLGAALLLGGVVWPFGTQAILVLMSLVMLSRINIPPVAADDGEEVPSRKALGQALRWTIHHPAVRTLIVTVFSFNIMFAAAWSVLVLWAQERLGLGDVGYGLITTAGAIGGLLGVAVFGRLSRRFSLGNLLRAGLVVETATHFVLANTTIPWVAFTVFVVFGVHGYVWGVTSITIQQRAVPSGMQGRVGGLNSVGVFGGSVLGSILGGWIAHGWGVTAPFWFAGVGSLVLLLVLWPQLRHLRSDAGPDQEDTSEV